MSEGDHVKRERAQLEHERDRWRREAEARLREKAELRAELARKDEEIRGLNKGVRRLLEERDEARAIAVELRRGAELGLKLRIAHEPLPWESAPPHECTFAIARDIEGDTLEALYAASDPCPVCGKKPGP